MEASDLAQWKRFAAKGGIGKCTAIVDCAAETPGDLMFFQEDEITVLTPIEGQEGRYLGYCEGVVGQFSGDDVRFHGKLKTTVAVRRITGVSTPSTSSLGHASPRLPAQESSFSSSEPQSQATSRAASPSAAPSLLSPRHTTRISTEQLSKYTSPTIPPSSSAASTLLSPTIEPTEAPTSRSSFTSATETSLPHTPGDITENEHEAADPGVRVERNSTSPRRSAEAPEKHHARAGDVVNALLEKVRYRDTTSSFGDDPLIIRDSVATMSSRADSLPLIPNAFRGSLIEEEEEGEDLQDGEEDTENPDGEESSIRDSIASSLTSSPPPRFSKPPPLSESNPPQLDEDPLTTRDATRDSIASSYIKQSGVRDSVASSHYDDDEGVRASMASSDGGFGIGMQFIQGLIGNPTARSAESGYDDEEDDDEDVGSGRVTSMFTDESFHLPDWGTAARLPTQQEEDEAEEPSRFGLATTTRTSLEDKDPTPPANPASPVPNSSVPHTRTPSPRSSISSYADEPNPQPIATSPPRSDGQPDRPIGSLDRRPETFESPTEAEFDPNGTSFVPGPQSPGFPGSGSEAGGSYYEEDLDIYDNYRYSRFSMLSRKSRKSQINMSFPDPSTMPALEDTIGSFPLPPPLNTSRTLPLRSDSSDRLVTSPKSASSFSQSSKGKQTSPNRFDFPPQPIQPLVLSARKQLSVDTAPLPSSNPGLSPGRHATAPPSPGPLSAKSFQFASALRQQIEDEEKKMKEEQEDDIDGHSSDEDGSVVGDKSRMSSRTQSVDIDAETRTSRIPGAETEHSRNSLESPIVPVPSLDVTVPTDQNTIPPTDILPEPRRMSNVQEESEATETGNPSVAARTSAELGASRSDERRSLAPPTREVPSVERKSLSPMDVALAQLEGRKSPAPAAPSESLTPEQTAALASHFSIENPAGQFVSPSGRRLTFLPHPGAPKPQQQGPRQPSIYLQTAPQQQQLQQQQQVQPPPSPAGPPSAPQRPPLHAVIGMLIAHYRNPPPPVGGRPPAPATLHGRCKVNLQDAMGPVRIDWYLDNGNGPPPPEEAPRPPAVAIPGSPLRSSTLDVPPSPGVPNPDSGRTSPGPRHNFFPRPVPRSRPYSSMTNSFIQSTDSSRKHDSRQGFRAPSMLSVGSSGRSSVSSASVPKSPLGPSGLSQSSSNDPRAGRTPPPISIPRSPASASAANLRSPPPSSPLAQPPLTSSLAPSTPGGPGSTLSPNLSPRMPLRAVASTSALRSEVSGQGPPPSPGISPSPQLAVPPSPVPSAPRPESPDEQESITSPVSVQASLANDNDSMISRSHSLRSKTSAMGSRPKGAPGSSNPGTPTNAQAHFELSDQKVHVKDGSAAMEFEIVKPLIPRIAEVKVADGDSEASDHVSLVSENTRNDVESNLSHSPAVSTSRLPAVDIQQMKEPEVFPVPTDPATIQAHREREQKWLSVMNSTSASSAKKNKKVRKLVQEGIPNSVRSVVWLYLTNIKSRRMNGLYAQLCSRGRVGASGDIERDADRSFPAHPHLRDPKGPIVTLLQAYLRMVPDIAYEQGLAAMAGTILLQSPEEDAFWTFMALMDNHLRGYFAVNSNQMIVDARLLQKAVETADSALAKKLYTELRLDPVEIARPWFAAMFVNTLPNRYLYRVWDVFICDGASWLFRVALTLLIASKAFIMSRPSISATEVLDYLFRPPAQVLPADADTFIAACYTVKLKEDELRKLRPKIEASLKQQPGSSSRLIQIKDLRAITPLSS